MAAAASAGTRRESNRALGRLAAGATTMHEDAYAALFEQLVGSTWPTAFVCTGTDIDSGELKVWDQTSSVPLARAVAASCSVPLVFPVVSIGGHRYIDGGMQDPLNAGIARGHETVIAVSCFPLTATDPGQLHPATLAQQRTANTALDDLRGEGSRLAIVEPDNEFLAISAGGSELMNMSRLGDSYLAGTRLGARSARGIAALQSHPPAKEQIHDAL